MTLNEKRFAIGENVQGTWYFHLYEISGKEFKALCGKKIMTTEMKLTQWNYVSKHIGERYCKQCEALAVKMSTT